MVAGENVANLLHLIGFGKAAARLKIDDLRNALAMKDVVTAFDAQFKAQMRKHPAEILKIDVGIR